MARSDRALYRLFLALYPRDFRATHARELAEQYAWSMRAARSRGVMFARVRGFVDAVRAAVALRRADAPMPARAGGSGSFTQDVRFAVRTFRRTPLFTAGAILVLALGIGANGAIFSLVRAVLLEPLPYDRPDELVMVWHSRPDRPFPRVSTSTPIKSWRDQRGGALHDIAATRSWEGNPDSWFDVVLPGGAERLRAGLVTPNFFTVLGTRPLHGRVFTGADEAAGETSLVVLGHGLWQRAFGADPTVVGRSVTFVSGAGRARAPKPYTIVGVLPPGFRFTYPVDTELWTILPWAEIDADPGSSIQYSVAVARLAPGVAFHTANARMSAIDPGTDRPDTPLEQRSRTHLQPIADWVSGPTRPTLFLLSGVAVLLLVIACATIANGLLVRLAERQRELGLRAALGASRQRLLRQLLVEGLALSVAGTIAGCALASVLLPAFRSIVPAIVVRADEMSVDLWMIVFAAVVATVVTVLAAVVPAWHGGRQDCMTAIRQASASTSASRRAVTLRRALIAGQATVATALVAGAALLLLSFWRIGRVDLGFDAEGLWTVEMRTIDQRFQQPESMARFQEALVERARAIPGVTGVGLTTAVPFRGVDFYRTYDRPGCVELPRTTRPAECSGRSVGAHGRSVDSEFLSLMQIPLVAGRSFDARDTATSMPVAVVSASFARALFGDENPIGQYIDSDFARLLKSPSAGQMIIGIVGDVRYGSYGGVVSPAVYSARSQDPAQLVCLVVRAEPGIPGMAQALRTAVRDVDPTVPAMHITTIDRIMAESVADRRFYTTTTTVFAGLALLLTATGLIVVIARSVVERRREMAIRTALGARASSLVALAARQGMAPVVVGAAAGLVAAWFAAQLIEPFLFELTIHDPRVYAVAGVLTVVVGAVASLMPARRLTSQSPALVLRGE
jgi:putative ABC transport system permease protein